MSTTRIKIESLHASGGRKGYHKLITKVIPGQNWSRAFEGEFLENGPQLLPIGAAILEIRPGGTHSLPEWSAHVHTVTADGLSEFANVSQWPAGWLRIKDAVEAVLLSATPTKSAGEYLILTVIGEETIASASTLEDALKLIRMIQHPAGQEWSLILAFQPATTL